MILDFSVSDYMFILEFYQSKRQGVCPVARATPFGGPHGDAMWYWLLLGLLPNQN